MSSEEEQLKQLKQWWDENGVSTLVSIALAVAVVMGWQGWQRNQAAQLDAGAFEYQKFAEAVESVRRDPDDIKIAQATYLAEQLKENFADTGYAYFAALHNARQAVVDKDYELAESELRWILDQEPGVEISSLVKLRLARVLMAAGRYDEAVGELPADTETAFAPLYAELRGDIALAQQRYDAARDAYQQAADLATQLELPAPDLLEVKLQYAAGRL